ncbi:MAG: hypothetical protein HY300_11800 [Verrucomicrobia bacterium]|nr:hypothetical protein [Verrucomicrobiota bacterium]
MKTLARIGAVLSFAFFFLPGAWVLCRAKADEAFAVILGCVLIGIAFFVGPVLWLIGEKCRSPQDRK